MVVHNMICHNDKCNFHNKEYNSCSLDDQDGIVINAEGECESALYGAEEVIGEEF